MRSLMMLCALLLGMAVSPADAAGEHDTLHMYAKAEVGIDAEGRVTDVAFLEEEKMIAAVRDPLARAIRSWAFEPARIGDRPVESRTTVTVGVRAERLGEEDAFVLRITSASAGAGARDTTPPRYPAAAVRAGIEARVVLRVAYDENGVPTEVETMELALSRDRERTARSLEKATHDTAYQWRFIPEVVQGRPIAGAVQVPVSFCIVRNKRRGSCFAEQQAAFPDGTLLAEQPATRILTEVIGTQL